MLSNQWWDIGYWHCAHAIIFLTAIDFTLAQEKFADLITMGEIINITYTSGGLVMS